MKVLLYVTVSRDGYIAGKYDDISRISPESQTQRARLVNGVGNMIVGRRTYDTMCRAQRFDTLQDPFVTIMSKHNYPSQPNRHFTHAKPKNILKLLDEKGRSSTVVAWWRQVNKLFLEQWLVDYLILDQEPAQVGEWRTFSSVIPANTSLELVNEHEYTSGHTQKTYIPNNDTSSHAG